MTHDDFVQIFRFEEDTSKPGRILSTVKIGGVFMTRLEIAPKVTTGNYYHKKMRLLYYVESGTVISMFEHVKTKKKRRIGLGYKKRVVHVPTYVAIATKNVGRSPAIIVFFSNMPIRSPEDCFEYKILD